MAVVGSDVPAEVGLWFVSTEQGPCKPLHTFIQSCAAQFERKYVPIGHNLLSSVHGLAPTDTCRQHSDSRRDDHMRTFAGLSA